MENILLQNRSDLFSFGGINWLVIFVAVTVQFGSNC